MDDHLDQLEMMNEFEQLEVEGESKSKNLCRYLKKCFSGPIPYICFFLCLIFVTVVIIIHLVIFMRWKLDENEVIEVPQEYITMHYYTSVTIDSTMNISYYGISTTPIEIEEPDTEDIVSSSSNNNNNIYTSITTTSLSKRRYGDDDDNYQYYEDSKGQIHLTYPMDYYLYRCEEFCFCGEEEYGSVQLYVPSKSRTSAYFETYRKMDEECKNLYGSDCYAETTPSKRRIDDDNDNTQTTTRRQYIEDNSCLNVKTEMYEKYQYMCYGKCTNSPHLGTHDLVTKSENYGCENLEVSGIVVLYMPVPVPEEWEPFRKQQQQHQSSSSVAEVSIINHPSKIEFASNFLDPHCRENSGILGIPLCVGFDEFQFDVPENGTVYCQRRMM